MIDNSLIKFMMNFNKNILSEIIAKTEIQNTENDKIIGTFEATIISVNENRLKIKLSNNVIEAYNKTNNSFKEGDRVILSVFDYKNGKLLLKYVKDEDSKNSLENNKIKLSLLNNRISDTLIRLSFDELKDKISHAKIGLLNKNQLIEVNVKLINNSLYIDNKFISNLNENKNLPLLFEGQGTIFQDSNNGLLLSLIFDKKLNNIIDNIKKIFDIDISKPIDRISLFNLLIDGKNITNEVFQKEKHSIIEKLTPYANVLSDYSITELTKNKLIMKNNKILIEKISVEDIYLSIKFCESVLGKFNEEDVISNIVFLNSDKNDQHYSVFSISNNDIIIIPNLLTTQHSNYIKSDTILMKKQKNKLNKNINSIAVILDTENLGLIAFYIKKNKNYDFRVVFSFENFNNYRIFKDYEKKLISYFIQNGYNLSIEYKLEHIKKSKQILYMILDEYNVNLYDVRV